MKKFTFNIFKHNLNFFFYKNCKYKAVISNTLNQKLGVLTFWEGSFVKFEETDSNYIKFKWNSV